MSLYSPPAPACCSCEVRDESNNRFFNDEWSRVFNELYRERAPLARQAFGSTWAVVVMGAAGSSTSTSHALQNCLRLPQACPPDRVARLCAALRDVGMPPTGVQVSAHGDLILFEPIPHTTISTTTPTPGLVAGVQAVRPPAQQPGRQPGRQLGSTAAVTAPDSAREMGAAAPGARAASTASGALEPFLAPSLPPSVDGGVTFKYDGYIRTGHTMAVLAWTQLCTCTQHLACASHALVRWAACVAPHKGHT